MVVFGGSELGGQTFSYSLIPFACVAERERRLSPSASTGMVIIFVSLTGILIRDILVPTGALLYKPLSDLNTKLIREEFDQEASLPCFKER